MENTTLTSNNLTTDKSFNGTIWRPLNSDLNDELVFRGKMNRFEIVADIDLVSDFWKK